jgi:co-chaperonin GroES (HSP10)
MNESVRPLGARVLVRALDEESVTPSGLFIPDAVKGETSAWRGRRRR